MADKRVVGGALIPLGLVLVALGLLADAIGLGGAPGFGYKQIILVIAGALGVLVGWKLRKTP